MDPVSISRPLATAASLGTLASDANRFIEKAVLLTGADDVLRTQNGQQCFLSAVRLLPRICARVTISLPTSLSRLRTEAESVAKQVAFMQPITLLECEPRSEDYDAVLVVGTRNAPGGRSTVINSNGWVARVASGSSEIASECRQSNPVAAFAAACLGVSEVFKRLICLKPQRGAFFDGLAFSLYTCKPGAVDAGPELPPSIPVDLVLVGAGAIGNGVAHLIRALPITGTVHVVDRQAYGVENLGTCCLIGPSEIEMPKAKLFERVLERPGLNVTGYAEELEVFEGRLGADVAFPRIVVNGVDNIEARHLVQRWWPDIIVDGAIGTFECQVSTHPWGPDVACLLCLFRNPDESADAIASSVTGLAVSRTHEPEARVTDTDVELAPAGRREFLQTNKGRRICSVVQEAVAQSISEAKLRKGFQPSVPFVACLSSCLIMTELVRMIAGWPAVLEPRFQMDLLQGPAYGQYLPQHRRRDCICMTRSGNIDMLRQRRSSRTT